MITEIHILPGLLPEKKELKFPFVKLTRSLNKKTGTATFLFFQPFSFQEILNNKKEIYRIWLLKDDKKIPSHRIEIFFQYSKPLFLKAIFVFKSSQDWLEFLNFMSSYSKENGFLFEPETFEPESILDINFKEIDLSGTLKF